MSALTAVKYEVRALQPEEQPQLEQMYDAFVPLGEALGLPPPSPVRRRAWLESLRGGYSLRIPHRLGEHGRGADGVCAVSRSCSHRGTEDTEEEPIDPVFYSVTSVSRWLEVFWPFPPGDGRRR